jgi:hypothetical protein
MPRTISCPVVVHADVSCRADGVAALRDVAVPGAPALPARFLRHADEHTVVGVRAVQKASASLAARGVEWAGRPDRFAVVAAPCGAGRSTSARTLVALREGGPVTVSPHVVPQCSLHAVASAVSVGLGIHGPNIGVGGGPEALSEAFVTALSLLDEPGVEGCWLVLTAWDEEPALDERGAVPGGAVCRGVALGLDRRATGSFRLSLRTVPMLAVMDDGVAGIGHGYDETLATFAAMLARAGADDDDCDGCLWSLRLGWGALLNLERETALLAMRDRRRTAA